MNRTCEYCCHNEKANYLGLYWKCKCALDGEGHSLGEHCSEFEARDNSSFIAWLLARRD